MKRYDPLVAPEPGEWLALDEQERIRLVSDYHRRAGLRSRADEAHAAVHAAVENQIALRDETPAAAKLRSLMAEGLDRHEAVHAIGSVLIGYLNASVRDGGEGVEADYHAELAKFTASDWYVLDDDDEVDVPGASDSDGSAAEGSLDAASPSEIIARLDAAEALPIEAIEAARAKREATAPAFVAAVENYLASGEAPRFGALYFIFHLLGEWREKAAYRPLAKLLQRPSGEIDTILNGAITGTCHRIMAQVFDGDPRPLYEIILNPHADEYVRARICDTVAILAMRGELARAETEGFLRKCYADLRPRNNCFVWDGWQNAISILGLTELTPLVEDAFRLGCIDTSSVELSDFKDGLRNAMDATPAHERRIAQDCGPFDDTIEELSDRDFSDDWTLDDDIDVGTRDRYASIPTEPAVNPFKGTGRNDPCPCGSGKKFKKCCLERARDWNPAELGH